MLILPSKYLLGKILLFLALYLCKYEQKTFKRRSDSAEDMMDIFFDYKSELESDKSVFDKIEGLLKVSRDAPSKLFKSIARLCNLLV